MTTTSEQVAKEDTLNMEHIGEWDHGVEPDALNRDNAPSSSEPKDHRPPPAEAVQPLVKRAQAVVEKAVHSMEAAARSLETAASNALAESKDGVEHHTEEEVMGVKMCVSKTVHQDSFIAP